jgi:hypothetical protein
LVRFPEDARFEEVGIFRHRQVPTLREVLEGSKHASPMDCRVWDVKQYQAATLSRDCVQPVWKAILSGHGLCEEAMGWTTGVNLDHYWLPEGWSGIFDRVTYCAEQGGPLLSPPRFKAKNAPSCKGFEEFIDTTVDKWSTTGVCRQVQEEECWCCLPLMVEPDKPRLCLDGRFPNLFTQTRAYRHESVSQVPQVVRVGDLMWSLDHKAGFNHVPVARGSQKYLGFCWRGKFYVMCVMPFGWSLAPYVYNTLTGAVAS